MVIAQLCLVFLVEGFKRGGKVGQTYKKKKVNDERMRGQV